MAITFYGTQATVNEATGAFRWSRAGVAFLTDTPGQFRVSAALGQTRTVNISRGTAQVCGVLLTETAPQQVALDANTSGTDRYDVVALKVSWAGAGRSSATYAVLKGGATPPTIPRSAGFDYYAPLAVVRVSPNVGQITGSMINGLVPYSGRGGPIRVPQSRYLELIDARPGAELVADDTGWGYRMESLGTWTAVSSDYQPWKTWDPALYSDKGPVILGTGGVSQGRYKIIRGMCFAEVEVRRGVAGSDFGWGIIRMNLPPDAVPNIGGAATDSTGLLDQWMLGHLYTRGDGLMDWRCQVAVRDKQSWAPIFVTTKAADSRLLPWRCSEGPGRGGTGIPWQGNNQYTEAEVFTAVMRYAIGQT